MNLGVKTTPALSARGRAVDWIRDALSHRQLAVRSGGVARAVVPLLGLALATLLCPAPVLAGAYTASGGVGQDFYPSGPPGVGSVSPTKATFHQEYTSSDLYLFSDALSTSGNIHLSALASINGMTNWSSGHVWSNASARIVEPVDPSWDMWASFGTTFIFQYEVGITGSLYTTSDGYGSAGSQASLGYSYHIGDSSGSGDWSQDSAGHVSKTGTWNGTVSSSFTVHPGSSFDLELVATAAAWGGKTYSPGGNATVVGIADFSHTFTWLGITGVRAFDDLGNEVVLPPGAQLPLIGRDSGFDYWNSATPVPEPSTALLLGSGLIAAGLLRKAGARARDS